MPGLFSSSSSDSENMKKALNKASDHLNKSRKQLSDAQGEIDKLRDNNQLMMGLTAGMSGQSSSIEMNSISSAQDDMAMAQQNASSMQLTLQAVINGLDEKVDSSEIETINAHKKNIHNALTILNSHDAGSNAKMTAANTAVSEIASARTLLESKITRQIHLDEKYENGLNRLQNNASIYTSPNSKVQENYFDDYLGLKKWYQLRFRIFGTHHLQRAADIRKLIIAEPALKDEVIGLQKRVMQGETFKIRSLSPSLQHAITRLNIVHRYFEEKPKNMKKIEKLRQSGYYRELERIEATSVKSRY